MDGKDAIGTAQAAVDAVSACGVPGDVAGKLRLLSVIQGLRNRLDALANDVLIGVAEFEDAGLAAEDDGDLGGDFVGRLELHSQAPELVAPCLGVSVLVARNRVVTAVGLAQRAPELVEEMRQGRLDAFRAGVVHAELADAPAPVAEQVVRPLLLRADRTGGWDESAGPLGRRARSLLAKFAPEVIAARVAAAREFRGLHKRGESECLDRWEGVYHVEDSRMAWAAIDELAQRFVKAGTADTLQQARADAHIQLLLGHCDVTVHLHATEPAPDVMATRATATHAAANGAAAPPRPEDSGARLYVALSPARPARAAEPDVGAEPAAGVPRFAAAVELGGFGGPGTCLVRGSWLAEALATGRVVIDAPVGCHPVSGAVIRGAIARGFARGRVEERAGTDFAGIDFAGTEVATEDVDPRYRIPAAMARLVRFRDRQCRFPGCAVSARFCDLDHVLAWPEGPTSPGNLMCLCRRHHRLKQSPGWDVTIHADLTVTWTDPIGRSHTSYPVDHLGVSDDTGQSSHHLTSAREGPATRMGSATPGRPSPTRPSPRGQSGPPWQPGPPEVLSPLEARLASLLVA